ncbi:L10-interacting MYB domain-containing protein-like [Diospyros lotus]|uniref:L10-interacting MYB domain-containing protein-like n=1 Tax=Diospyros lotus TaxID=55363 RepID=UPI0022572C04|nr:L10-interacting MYB domain-containing protein-like [Diospyros lotus]
MDKGKKKMNNISNTGRYSAKWDDQAHLQFIELVKQEIQKGNRPGSFINKDGWRNLVKSFNELSRKCYDNKQLKNHWDSRKKELTLFKQMMRGESATGEKARAPCQYEDPTQLSSTDKEDDMDKRKKKMNNISNKGRYSAKWDDQAHLQFIELVKQEIQKGNRPGSFINKDGWKNLVKSFNELSGKCYDNK